MFFRVSLIQLERRFLLFGKETELHHYRVVHASGYHFFQDVVTKASPTKFYRMLLSFLYSAGIVGSVSSRGKCFSVNTEH